VAVKLFILQGDAEPLSSAPVWAEPSQLLIGMWLFAPQSFWLEIVLEAQWTSEVKLWQTCYEIGEKSSKFVPLGAPFFQ
jgi:hypothetical protein